MDKPKTTPKDFFLWAGAMVTLFGSVIAFINLLFGYINYTFPDALNNYAYVNPYDNGISYAMASFIIFGAACLVLMRVIHKTIEKDSTRADIWVRRWALYLTLFLAGMAILIDLIVLLNIFFAGEELTTRFLLKVAVVLLVAAGLFMHFLADLRGYWTKQPMRANSVTIATALVAVITVVAGFFIIGTPWQARQYRLDEQKLTDLQNIQYQVVYYWQQKQKLPTTLIDLTDSISGYSAPVDSQTGQPYVYQPTGPMSFKLCATFNAAGSQSGAGTYPIVPEPAGLSGANGSGVENWQHSAGQQCFDRTIDPQRYPPITPPTKK
jgi:hypothetical protein